MSTNPAGVPLLRKTIAAMRAAVARGYKPNDYGPPNADAGVMTPEERAMRLASMGNSLLSKRKRAVDGKYLSGIEIIWQEDQDAYEGIDDANRWQEAGTRGRWGKPTSMTAPLQSEKPDRAKSTVLLNITRAYVDAGAARVGDMILPMDDRPWALDPPENPDLLDHVKNPQPLGPDEQQQLASMHPPQQEQPEQPPLPAGMLPPESPKGAPQTTADLATAIIEKALKSAKRAEKRIDDWLKLTKWHSEFRRAIDDAARLGTGILKGPFPKVHKSVIVNEKDGATEVAIENEIVPGSKRIDPWNLYPDPQCGENIHNGSYVFERDDITAKVLRELLGTPGALDDQIEQCLIEGPQKHDQTVDRGGTAPVEPITEDTPYEIWYFHGLIDRDDMRAAGIAVRPDEEATVIPVSLTMVNSRVVRAAMNPISTGDFPYDVMVWQARVGMPWGIGVSRQLRTPQRMITAGVRNTLENAGLSSGPQIVILKGKVEPADGNYTLYPRKVWYASPSANINDLKAAFMSVQIDCNQADLMAIIQFALRMAEDVTGLPMILQGQASPSTPNTLGGMQMLNNNASAVMRRLARQCDASIIEPHVGRYYEWLLEHGENPDEKQNFVVTARGSSVLVERDLQAQELIQMATLVQNPAYRIDPAKYFAELCRSRKLKPESLQYSDDEWKRIQENMAKQPGDPRLAVAQINEAIAKERNASAAQIEQLKQEGLNAREAAQRNLDAMIAHMDSELETMKAQGVLGVDVAKVKAMLAKVAAEISAEERMNASNNGLDLHKHQNPPPVQVPGRAAPGHAADQTTGAAA